MLAFVLPVRARLLALPCALLALAVLPGAAPAKGVTPSWHGVQVGGIRAGIPDEAIHDDLEQAKLLGANIVRSDVDWAQLEPTEGQYDEAYIARVDRFMAEAR